MNDDEWPTSGTVSLGRCVTIFVAKARYFLFMNPSPRKACKMAIAMYALEGQHAKGNMRESFIGDRFSGHFPNQFLY